MDKREITRVLEALGPERVERGVPALQQQRFTDIWSECFLGRALGIPAGIDATLIAAQLVPVGHYCDVTHAFDHERGALRVLVEEWLEANRVPQEAPQPEAAHVPVSGVPLPV